MCAVTEAIVESIGSDTKMDPELADSLVDDLEQVTNELKIVEDNPADYPDSSEETKKHISLVKKLAKKFVEGFTEQIKEHDKTKLEGLEKRLFDKFAYTQSTRKPLSKEYEDDRKDLNEALKHHYASNRHHPEHFGELGVAGMNLFDLIEHFLDMLATSQKYMTGDIYQSLDILSETRFHYPPELLSIFKNTASDIFKAEHEADKLRRLEKEAAKVAEAEAKLEEITVKEGVE